MNITSIGPIITEEPVSTTVGQNAHISNPNIDTLELN